MKDNIKNTYKTNKSIVSAAIVAVFLMFLFGLSHRILAGHFMASGEMPPIDPNALAKFPMEIGSWTGREMPLEEAIIEATDTDAHISRSYSRNNGLEAVAFYVAFGQRARDLMPHRPEVCYVGAGWTRDDIESVELPLGDGAILPCTILQFSRGPLIKSRILLLDYYIVDGSICRDISLLRSKIWRGSGSINYTAQIQISVPILASQDIESAKETVSAFAVDSAPLLQELLASFITVESEVIESTDSNNISTGEISDRE